METIRQTVEVKSDRKLEINLPDNLNPGLFEVVIVLQPIAMRNKSQKSLTSFIGAAKGSFSTPEEVDQFIRQERDAWE